MMTALGRRALSTLTLVCLAAAQATIDARPGEIDRTVLLAHMLIDTPEKMRGRKLFIVARNDLGGNARPRLDGIRKQYDQAPDPIRRLLSAP